MRLHPGEDVHVFDVGVVMSSFKKACSILYAKIHLIKIYIECYALLNSMTSPIGYSNTH